MRTYSLTSVPVPATLAAHRQTTVLVRATSKRAALKAFSDALGAKVNETDWKHSGQVDIPKFALLLSTVPPGVVLYEAGRRWSDDWRRFDAGVPAR